jgi:hypothetical protein
MDVEVGDPIQSEHRVERRIDGRGVRVLQREHIDLADGLRAIEGDLHPVGELAVCHIIPIPARTRVEAVAIAVVHAAHRVARVVGTGRHARTL